MFTDIFNVLQLQKQPHHQHSHWVQKVQQQGYQILWNQLSPKCAVCQLTRLYHPSPVIHYVVQVTSIYYSSFELEGICREAY